VNGFRASDLFLPDQCLFLARLEHFWRGGNFHEHLRCLSSRLSTFSYTSAKTCWVSKPSQTAEHYFFNCWFVSPFSRARNISGGSKAFLKMSVTFSETNIACARKHSLRSRRLENEKERKGEQERGALGRLASPSLACSTLSQFMHLLDRLVQTGLKRQPG